MKIQSVLFDLDGTFADTAPDLALALNQTLKSHQRTELDFERIRPVVSHGGKALIELGFGITDRDPAFEDLRQQLLTFYRNDIAVHTQLFDGMERLLDQLESAGIHWGIVTNKPSWLTDPLLNALQLDERACCIVSGDTLPQRKPHPAPLLHAAQLCGVAASACLYVGDAERDVVAGKAAMMKTMVANYGYIAQNDRPEQWQADSYINHPDEIFAWVTQMNQEPPLDNRYAN